MKKAQYQRCGKLLDILLRLGVPGLQRRLVARVYDDSFYAETREVKREPYRNVAAILARHLTFQSILDIGCGTGQLLAEWKLLGKDVLGCEVSAAAILGAPPEITVFQADATRPIRINHRFDLVVCIEVAEHIPRRHSQQLVENCASLGDQVCFTAAPKGQAGVGHINLRPYSFWIDLFSRHGFTHLPEAGQRIREQMRAQNVLSWIPNNLLIFSRLPSGQSE